MCVMCDDVICVICVMYLMCDGVCDVCDVCLCLCVRDVCDVVGEKHVRDAIFDATWNVINEGKYVTSDIGGSATTTQMAKAISEIARKNLKK